MKLTDTYYPKSALVYKDYGGVWEIADPVGAASYYNASVSGNGQCILIAVYSVPGAVYYSSDFGATWTDVTPNADHQYYCSAMDYDGSVLLVGQYGGDLYVSTDSGANWTLKNPASADSNWSAIDVDYDGSAMIAAATSGRVYISTDSGANWTEVQPKGDSNGTWLSAATDLDGSVFYIVEQNGRIWFNTASGVGAWTESRPDGNADHDWRSIDCSTDGAIAIVCEHGGRVWVTGNTGSTWFEVFPTTNAAHDWNAVCCSYDGAYMGAAEYGGRLYVSFDTGANWEQKRPAGDANANWSYIKCSNDGHYWTSAVYGGRVYASKPQQVNKYLPVVYGTLHDGSSGIWELPCIEKSTNTYALAGHDLLDVVDGNAIYIYIDGVASPYASPGGAWSYSIGTDYRGLGTISTITFVSDQGNSVITARAMGKVLTGTTVMDNIIDIVYDFLTVENTFSSALIDSTAKAKAKQVFTGQGYLAAGVITEPIVVWDAITEMMASFLGSAYLNGNGDLVLDIDDNTVPQSGVPIIPRGRAPLIDAKMRLVNIVNQCPAQYGYNYADGEYANETDETAHADLASQGIYGIMEPSEPYQFAWCRDLTSVQKMQDLIVAKLKSPLYEIEIQDKTLNSINLDTGDFFAYSADRLYDESGSPLYNQIWKVISVNPDFSAQSITFRALQTPYYMTSGASRDTTIY